MLKIHQHTTKLSRALLTAGLLGGVGVATLGAGSAQAVWTPTPAPSVGYSCMFNGACTLNEPTPILNNDKRLTLLDWFSIPTLSDLEFSYQPLDSITPWHVDLDFNPDDMDGGSLTYKIESFMGNFDLVKFNSARDSNTSLTKTYGTGWDGTNITGVIDILSLTNNVSDSGPAYGSVLYVKDVWNGPGAIDNLSNKFHQEVPAPLPILGAGAAFGSIRKLRKFSARLKTFSMG